MPSPLSSRTHAKSVPAAPHFPASVARLVVVEPHVEAGVEVAVSCSALASGQDATDWVSSANRSAVPCPARYAGTDSRNGVFCPIVP